MTGGSSIHSCILRLRDGPMPSSSVRDRFASTKSYASSGHKNALRAARRSGCCKWPLACSASRAKIDLQDTTGMLFLITCTLVPMIITQALQTITSNRRSIPSMRGVRIYRKFPHDSSSRMLAAVTGAAASEARKTTEEDEFKRYYCQ
jgi:hypothetical protein